MNDQFEALARTLEESGAYRILRHFEPRDRYGDDPGTGLRRLMVLDTETTGLDCEQHKILELGYVVARFDPATGKIVDVVDRYNGLQDPGEPVPPEITRLCGITDEDVRGQALDDGRIEQAIGAADLIIAHNARFDRGFVEKRYPCAENAWWACSRVEGPWEAMQMSSTKLEWLAFKVAGLFYGAHRALTDAELLLQLLSCPAHDETPVLRHILESSRRMTHCVWATNSPFDKKDALKIERRFQWSDGSDPRTPIKAWYKDGVPAGELDALLDDLRTHIYEGRGVMIVDDLTGRERFTHRVKNRRNVSAAKGEPTAEQ